MRAQAGAIDRPNLFLAGVGACFLLFPRRRYMGFPSSSGAEFMQYLVTDRIVSPPEYEHLYTEALAHMPNSYFVNDYRQSFACIPALSDDERRARRAAYGVPANAVVYAMFNQLYKIAPEIFASWMRILKVSVTSLRLCRGRSWRLFQLTISRTPPGGTKFGPMAVAMAGVCLREFASRRNLAWHRPRVQDNI